MSCAPQDPVRTRRALTFNAVVAIAYIGLVVLISWVVPISHLPNVIRIPAALTPVIPIVLMIWGMGRNLAEQKDEFIRMIQARGMLLATGFILVFATGWGFLQEYVGIGPFPAIILFPIWCAAWAVATAWTAWRYK